jgi:hypothetical protein
MATIRCDFCHEQIEKNAYLAHRAEHLKLRPDGQYSEHVTLPPEEREQGVLDNVPRVYVHGRCGAATVMPDEIIRSYLKNPWLYLADSTFCTGCYTYVPFSAMCVGRNRRRSSEIFRSIVSKETQRPAAFGRAFIHGIYQSIQVGKEHV